MNQDHKSPERIAQAARDAERRVHQLVEISINPEKFLPETQRGSYNSLHDSMNSLIEIQQRMEVTAHGYWTRIGHEPSFEEKYDRRDVLRAYNIIYDAIEKRLEEIETEINGFNSKKKSFKKK